MKLKKHFVNLQKKLPHELEKSDLAKLPKLNRENERQIDALVTHFNKNKVLFDGLKDQVFNAVQGSESLMKQVHTLKARIKDPEHLKDKLRRKFLDADSKDKPFSINSENLFAKINDLVGIRILHLHTQQIEQINQELKELFQQFKFKLVEGPVAKTWDDESRDYFKTLGFRTVKSPSLYTSVHYVIDSGNRTRLTCEIQVRTLAEELWGEVDHSINYPHAIESVACREQIKVLARATSSCSRLVDSIFRSEQDHRKSKKLKA
jgi:putative GTP pyrophosphokinase